MKNLIILIGIIVAFFTITVGTNAQNVSIPAESSYLNVGTIYSDGFLSEVSLTGQLKWMETGLVYRGNFSNRGFLGVLADFHYGRTNNLGYVIGGLYGNAMTVVGTNRNAYEVHTGFTYQITPWLRSKAMFNVLSNYYKRSFMLNFNIRLE